MSLVWLIGSTVAAIGAALLVGGLRGRGAAGIPRCRGCGQQVTEIQADRGPRPGDRCPECGRPLVGRGVTRRRIRRRLVLVGMILIVAGFGGAAAWPSPAWRVARMPTWWLLRLEWPLADARRQPLVLEELASRRADPAIGVPDEDLDDLVTEFIARVRSPQAAAMAPGTLDPWRRLFEEAVVAGLVGTPDVAFVHGHWTTRQCSAAPLPPAQLEVSWRIGGTPSTAGQPRTMPGAPSVLQSVAVEPSDVRVDGTSVVDPDLSWAGASSGSLGWGAATQAFSMWIDVGDAPLGPGPHVVELDLRYRAGPHAWTETLTTTVVMPSWPPAGHPVVGAALLTGSPPNLTLTTLARDAETRADRSSNPDVDAMVERLGGQTRVLVTTLTLDRQVVGVEGYTADMDLVLASGRVVRLPFLRSTIGSRPLGRRSRERAVAERQQIRLVHRLPDDADDVLAELPATVEVLVPCGRLRLRVPRTDLQPPPGAGEPESVQGWLPAPEGRTIRLTGVAVRNADH